MNSMYELFTKQLGNTPKYFILSYTSTGSSVGLCIIFIFVIWDCDEIKYK